MPQTRGHSSTKKDESSHEKSKTKRGRGRNNKSQDEQFQTANCGRGRGRGRRQSNKKSHLLNEILEDSDYEDTIELSLSGPFNLLPLNNTDLEELDSALAPRLESRNISTPLRKVQSNELENLSAPPHPEHLASRNLNTSTPLREVQSNELENLSVLSYPGLRDLNSPASLRSFNASASPTLPSCFNDMDTIFQLATWLCANPNVLQFANAIYSSMQTSLANGQQFTPSNLANPTALQLQSPLQEDKLMTSRNFLEELKCLFLRVRNPPKHALEELIRQIIKCNLNSVEGLEWLRIGLRQFGDFRNKFLDGIERLANLFKEKRNKQGILETTLPQKEDIDDFIDEEKTIIVLRHWLNAVKIDDLRREDSMIYLNNLVKKAVIYNYNTRDPERMKTLDVMTKNLAVPSRNGRNFA
ncbi:unnamed protein product [Rhizophagus irregularis]|nr:unnamed protein product [Rhizophagus irregularis]